MQVNDDSKRRRYDETINVFGIKNKYVPFDLNQ